MTPTRGGSCSGGFPVRFRAQAPGRAYIYFPRASQHIKSPSQWALGEAESVPGKESDMNTTTPRSPWLTTSEAATYLGLHPETVRQMCRAKELPATRVGRRYRLRDTDLDTYLEAQR